MQQGNMEMPTGSTNISLPRLLLQRQEGYCPSLAFVNRLVFQQCQKFDLLRDTRILNTPDDSSHQPSCIVVTSLTVHPVEMRYVLTGNTEGIVSIYDLSKYGAETKISVSTDHRSNNNHNHNPLIFNPHTTPPPPTTTMVYKPIAKSVRAATNIRTASIFMDEQQQQQQQLESEMSTPVGHAGTVVSARWYPVDSGVFVTASIDGNVLIWDTNQMQPVTSIRPFAYEQHYQSTLATRRFARPENNLAEAQQSSPPLTCMELSPFDGNRIAVGTPRIPLVKLMDLRLAGYSTTTQTLTGHTRGVTVVQWSPVCEYILATGSPDKCVRLWDIRKAGSRACLTVLDRDYQPTTATSDILVSRPYSPDLSHFGLKSSSNTAATTAIAASRVKKNGPSNAAVSPNDYRNVEQMATVSHRQGAVNGLAFTPDGHYLISTASDGEVCLWDLSSRGGSGGGGGGGDHLHRKKHPNVSVPAQPQLVPRRYLHPSGGTLSSAGRQGGGPSHVQITGNGRGSSDADVVTHTVWIPYGSRLLGYRLESGGGYPLHMLQGHLQEITAFSIIPNVSGTATMNGSRHGCGGGILTAGKDGLILAWGQPQARHSSRSGTTNRKRRYSHQGKEDRDQDTW